MSKNQFSDPTTHVIKTGDILQFEGWDTFRLWEAEYRHNPGSEKRGRLVIDAEKLPRRLPGEETPCPE